MVIRNNNNCACKYSPVTDQRKWFPLHLSQWTLAWWSRTLIFKNIEKSIIIYTHTNILSIQTPQKTFHHCINDFYLAENYCINMKKGVCIYGGEYLNSQLFSISGLSQDLYFEMSGIVTNKTSIVTHYRSPRDFNIFLQKLSLLLDKINFSNTHNRWFQCQIRQFT